MEKRNLYALLVGINNYDNPRVGDLRGCVNDVKSVKRFLNMRYGKFRLHIETLLNSDATRENVISAFRNHLSQAAENDIVLFHYSGHGSRELAAMEFAQYFPEGKNETLVLYDSRREGGYDLADKELAVLLADVAKNNPHFVVVLDCCHSGSGVRDVDEFRQNASRHQEDRSDPRDLESYIDGYYLKNGIKIPTPQLIALGACDKTQRAWEDRNHRGVFTTALLDVLKNVSLNISYANLFAKVRSAVLKYADNQTPQFEFYEGFNPHTTFLDGSLRDDSHRLRVFFDSNKWKISAGAVHGIPAIVDKPILLNVYNETAALSDPPLGKASATLVAMKETEIDLQFDANTKNEYQAEIISMPIIPVDFYISGEKQGVEMLQKALDEKPSLYVQLTDSPYEVDYGIECKDGGYQIHFYDTKNIVLKEAGYTQTSAEYIINRLEHIAKWERIKALENPVSKLKGDLIDMDFYELNEDDEEIKRDSDNIILDFKTVDGEPEPVFYTIKAHNRTKQKLNFMLLFLSRKFDITLHFNPMEIMPGQELIIDEDRGLGIADDSINEITEHFKLIVSTEAIDADLFVQPAIDAYQAHRDTFTRKVKKDWITKTITVKTIRQLNQVAKSDVKIASNSVEIGGHPAVEAKLSVSSSHTGTRSVNPVNVLSQMLRNNNFELITLGDTSDKHADILELNDIVNDSSLQNKPLRISVQHKISAGEFVIPLTNDGEHVLPAGIPEISDDGIPRVLISYIPDLPDFGRRSIGKSMKMMFLKTTRINREVQKLQYIIHNADKLEQKSDGLKERVAQANKILLFVHGFLENAISMAEQVKDILETSDYDLVLTFDYENLNTPLEQTALRLKELLLDAGLATNDNKQLIIAAHSSGGLLARYFVELIGGNELTDRLILTGTPNDGTALARFADYWNTSLSAISFAQSFLNFIPGVGTLLSVLSQTRQLTVVLQQLTANSPFLKALKAAPDPRIPYILLAANNKKLMDNNQQQSKLFDKLKALLSNTLNKSDDTDLIVSVKSALQLGEKWQHKPQKTEFAGNHFNYFSSSAYRSALCFA